MRNPNEAGMAIEPVAQTAISLRDRPCGEFI